MVMKLKLSEIYQPLMASEGGQQVCGDGLTLASQKSPLTIFK
jgi:hypothetical protein